MIQQIPNRIVGGQQNCSKEIIQQCLHFVWNSVTYVFPFQTLIEILRSPVLQNCNINLAQKIFFSFDLVPKRDFWSKLVALHILANANSVFHDEREQYIGSCMIW